MTLLKSFDKPGKAMFKNKLKSAVFFPAVGMIIMLLFAVVIPFSEVVRLNEPTRYSYDSTFLQLENVRYVIFGSIQPDVDFPDSAIFMYITVIIAAILCAIMVFKDLSNKKTANVYYSLGFSRTKLFASTYLAGAAAVLAMTIIPFVLSFIINAFSFGISKELLSALIFTVSVLCNVSLIAYTLAAIAMILSGMFVEGAFFAFFLNSISAMFAFSTCMFSAGLLTGGGFVDNNLHYAEAFANSFISAFLGQTSFLNSLAHSVYEVNRLGSCLYTPVTEGLSEYLSVETWKTPGFIPLLVWSVILVGLIFLAVYAFNKKKTENIGFFASNKVLYRLFFGANVLAFSSLGCTRGRELTKGLTWLYILILLAGTLIVTFLLNIILTKISRMKLKQEVKVFGIYSAAVILCAFLFTTGFFGYVNRIPAIEKVESVLITSFSNDESGISYGGGIYDTNLHSESTPIAMDVFDYGLYHNFVTKSDIADIQSLHKDLIEADNIKMSHDYKETKVGAKIEIEYTLKNGKTLSRTYYRMSPQIIDKYLACKGIAEEVKLNMTNNAQNMISAATSEEFIPSDSHGKFITAFSPDMTRATNLDLTDEQLYALLDAYTKDIEKLSVKQILAPSSKAVGVIAIRDDFDVMTYDDMDNYVYKGLGSELEYSSLTDENLAGYGNNGIIVITKDMKNTVKWAKEAGVYKHFAIDYKVGISTVEATHNNSSFMKLSISSNNNYNLLFSTRSFRDGDSYSKNNIYGENGYNPPLAGSHIVSELSESDIKYIRENAYPYFLTTQTGYFIRLSTNEKNSLHVTLFIPDSKLTPELKVKFAMGNDSASSADASQARTEHTTIMEIE